MTYKELMRELPDDITPEHAQQEYQAYLTRWWGSEVSTSTHSHMAFCFMSCSAPELYLYSSARVDQPATRPEPQIKAQFEAQKNDDAVRRRFDPREHQKAVEARNELAVRSAA